MLGRRSTSETNGVRSAPAARQQDTEEYRAQHHCPVAARRKRGTSSTQDFIPDSMKEGAQLNCAARRYEQTSPSPYREVGGKMPLNVLSALARLDLDPWQEAAELSELPKGTATQRLAALIARLTGGRWTLADLRAMSDRLIELLPSPGCPRCPLPGSGPWLMLGVSATAIVRAVGKATRERDDVWLLATSARRPRNLWRIDYIGS